MERFELAAADGVSPFKLGSLGMTFALPASGTATNVISAPMTLTCDQTWTFPATSGETLEITGGIGSLTANDVTLKGYGRVILRGSSTFTGSFKSSGGTRVDASARTGAFGLPGESGHNVSLWAVGNTFYGVTVEKPVTIGGGWDSNNYLVTPANCTNVFKGPVTLNYGRLALGGGGVSADGGACMRFEGGIVAASRIRLYGWGKAFVTNVPITANAAMDVDYCYDVGLSAPSNELTGISLNYGTVSLMTDRTLDTTNCTVKMVGDGVLTRIRLGGGFQQVGNLSLLSAGKILALQPSVFAFRQTTVVTNTAIDMQGPLSLLKTGPATFAVNRSLSANGMLDVAEGTFAFMENGTWLGATNVTVRGTGRIKLASGNTFSRRTTDVSLSETGVLELGEDVIQHCHNLYVNGTLVKKPGLYGGILAPEGASREYADFFDGKGALFVHGGRPPLVILVK